MKDKLQHFINDQRIHFPDSKVDFLAVQEAKLFIKNIDIEEIISKKLLTEFNNLVSILERLDR